MLHAFVTIAPGGMPFLNNAKIDARILIFTLSIGLLSTLGFGLVSGLSRERVNVLRSIRPLGIQRARLRQILVTTQIAASLALVAGGALLARSFWNLQHQNLGMNDENVLTATISLGQTAYPTVERQSAFFEQLERSLRWSPGVTAVAMSDSLPPGGYHHDQIYASMRVEGQPRFTSGTGGNVAWRWVTPEYFRILNIPLIEGSGFAENELSSPNRFVVISRSLAERMFPGQNPLGQQVHLATGGAVNLDPLYTVVGVAENVKNGGLAAGEEPEYYRLRRNRPEDWDRRAVVLIKSNLPAASMEHLIREKVAALDPALPIEVGTLQERVAKLADQPRFEMLLVVCFACTGLILAIIGLYGVTSFLMVQRKPEFGIRMALGASKGDIVRLVLASAMRMVVPGTIVGLVLAFSLSQLMSSLLFNVATHDGATFCGATIVLISATLIASLIPAIAAARVDPIATLRMD